MTRVAVRSFALAVVVAPLFIASVYAERGRTDAARPQDRDALIASRRGGVVQRASGQIPEPPPTSTDPSTMPGAKPPRRLNVDERAAPLSTTDVFAIDDEEAAAHRPIASKAVATQPANAATSASSRVKNPAKQASAIHRHERRESAAAKVSESVRADNVAIDGIGKPGPAHLDGAQRPSVTIHKIAPKEVQVGKPAMFTISVQNAGSMAVHGVELRDVVPRGARLMQTNPIAKTDGNGNLLWELGDLKPGDERTAQIELLPTSEGELGSVATVQFRAEASVRTTATRPQLEISVTGPDKVLIGEELPLKVHIANPGTGAATNVMLEDKLPAGLRHDAGAELELELGVLKPGESRDIDLLLKAAMPGEAIHHLIARADANLEAQDKMTIEVLAPELKVGLNGPKKRFLERSAVYTISVSNPGTAAAKDVELVTALPKGLKFVEANHHGHYDAASHSVFWSLEELPPRESGAVTLTALPLQPGELRMQVKGRANRGLSDELDETISVEGLAAVQFELVDTQDPVEVGGETTYEVRVTNQGSKAASNVQVVAMLPPELEFVSAEGPTKQTADGQRIVFQPLAQLAPKADTTYYVKVRGAQPGDLRFRAQLSSDENRAPITKEESTHVFADE